MGERPVRFDTYEIPAVRVAKLNRLSDRVESTRNELAQLAPAGPDDGQGEGGVVDPGDLTVYFDNGLI